MSRFATHGVCTARRAVIADPMERQGVTRSMHDARRKNCRAAAHRRGKSGNQDYRRRTSRIACNSCTRRAGRPDQSTWRIKQLEDSCNMQQNQNAAHVAVKKTTTERRGAEASAAIFCRRPRGGDVRFCKVLESNAAVCRRSRAVLSPDRVEDDRGRPGSSS
jgi:hypothetical protein